MAMAYIVCATVSRRNGERPSTAERIQVASLSAAEPVLGTYRSGIEGQPCSLSGSGRPAIRVRHPRSPPRQQQVIEKQGEHGLRREPGAGAGKERARGQ